MCCCLMADIENHLPGDGSRSLQNTPKWTEHWDPSVTVLHRQVWVKSFWKFRDLYSELTGATPPWWHTPRQHMFDKIMIAVVRNSNLCI